MPREVLLTGSVPRRPARAVFDALQRHVGDRVRRMPDGEQHGWLVPAWHAIADQPEFEPAQISTLFTDDDDSPFRDVPFHTWRLRDGASLDNALLDGFGTAETVADSYRQLRELKDEGVVREDVRFQATVVGAATVACAFDLPLADALALAERPLIGDVRAISRVVPHDELTVQLDLPVELELEEFVRRPSAWGRSYLEAVAARWDGWSLQKAAESVARVVQDVPDEAELGFHLCGLWHIDHRAGQDVQVHVDAANALTEAIGRRIDYIHLPSVPEHGPEDFAKLAGLRLSPDTKLFVGVIHQDGEEACERRLRDVTAVVPDAGVAHFCGLSELFRVEPGQLDEMLELHARLANTG